MNLQPLFDLKERLEQAAIAGTGLLGEDFRLTRAAEGLKPLAAASPVFAKIDAGLTALLSAPAGERGGLLLDLLALVDAVVYTQGACGMDGELEPLPAGDGTYCPVSYGQLNPLLAALTTTGGGRMEIIKSAWENHPEFFADYRVLPAVVAGLGDSYGEIADLNGKILRRSGTAAVPLLKEGFDPAGKKEMARRVEIVAALEGAGATPWLREVLPDAKKDVRGAIITALGGDAENTALLLELVKSERGANRDAALQSLAIQDGDEARAFWEKELMEHSQSVKFLEPSNADWAIELVTAGLRQRLERLLSGDGYAPKADCDDAARWCAAIGQKDSPVMLDFWKWADEHMEAIDRIKDEKGNPPFLGVRLTDHQLDTMRRTGPGPLRDYCLTLFDRRPEMTRYLRVSFQAALLSLPAAEVYERYASYILTKKPLLDKERRETLNSVLLRALGEVHWSSNQGCHVLEGGQATAQPLDSRWVERLVHTVCKPNMGRYCPIVYWEEVDGFDRTLMHLANPMDEETRKLLIPYLRRRLDETNRPYTYSRWLFQLGGSPKGVLGKAMVMNPKANRLGSVWELMNEAAKSLPAGEVAALLREILESKCVYQYSQPAAEKAIPWTIEQLLAGRPFPTLDDWNQ